MRHNRDLPCRDAVDRDTTISAIFAQTHEGFRQSDRLENDMEFDPASSFSDNLARFRQEAERIDANCARILLDNLDLLLARDEDATRTRQAVQEFNRAILTALDGLPEGPAV